MRKRGLVYLSPYTTGNQGRALSSTGAELERMGSSPCRKVKPLKGPSEREGLELSSSCLRPLLSPSNLAASLGGPRLVGKRLNPASKMDREASLRDEILQLGKEV